MLEILILIKLCSKISQKAKSKGLPGWPFGLLLFFMWFAAEIGGAIVCIIVFDEGPIVYIGGIIGAVLAALLAFALVGMFPTKEPRSGRWRRAEELFDLDESDTQGEIRRGDKIYAPVEIQPGDLLRLDQTDDGQVRLQTVFEDEIGDLPGVLFRAERSTNSNLPRLVPAKARPRIETNGDGYSSQSTQIQREPPRD